MPRYMVTRTLPPLTTDELKDVAARVVRTAEKMDNVTWIRSHVSHDGQHSFCELEAPSPDVLREHSRLAELPVDEIIPLGIDIGPVTFA